MRVGRALLRWQAASSILVKAKAAPTPGWSTNRAGDRWMMTAEASLLVSHNPPLLALVS